MQAFRKHAEAAQIAFVRIGQQGLQIVPIEREIAVQRIASAIVVHVAVDPLLVVEGLRCLPGTGIAVVADVKHHQARVGHLAEKRSDRLRLPELAVGTEQPALHHPGGLRIHLRDGAIQRLPVFGQACIALRWRYRFCPRSIGVGDAVAVPGGGHVAAIVGHGWQHFVEGIGQVELACAVGLGVQLKEAPRELGKQRIARIQPIGLVKAFPGAHAIDARMRMRLRERPGHVAGKCGQHRLHAQLAHARQDLLLQHAFAIDPVLRQRCAIAFDIAHALPRRERRAGKILRQRVIADIELAPQRLPDRFLAFHRQRHVDAMQGHPVDLALPARPIPERRGVAVGAGIEIGAVGKWRAHLTTAVGRPLRWQRHAVALPTHRGRTCLTEIRIGATRQGHLRGAGDAHRVAAGVDAIPVCTIATRCDGHVELGGTRADQALHDRLRGRCRQHGDGSGEQRAQHHGEQARRRR